MSRLQNNINALWWGLLGIVLIVGAGFYLTGYDRGLPLYESRDERRNLHEVYALRGISDDELWKPGYPPGILWVNHAAQVVTEWGANLPATQVACDVIRNVRLMGIPVHLLSALLIALIARNLGGAAAGILAAVAWLFSAGVLDQTQYAFPQTYEHVAYLLAFWFALLALQANKPIWAVLSVIAGLIAVIFKYTAFPVLGLGVGVALWQLRTYPRRWGTVLGVQAALIAVCAVWLFFGYGATQLIGAGHEETLNVVQGQTLANIFDPALVLLRARNLTAQIGMPLLAAIALIGVGAPIYWQGADTPRRLALLALTGMIAFQLLNVVLTLEANFDGLRQNIPATGLLAVLMVLMIGALSVRLGRLGNVLGMVLFAAWLMTLLWGGWQHIQYRRLPVSYAAFASWSVNTLPIDYNTGQAALLTLDDRPFTYPWSCERFPYFPAVQPGELDQQSIADWREQGVYFAQVDTPDLPSLPAGETTLLVQFPPPGEENRWRTWRRGLPEHRLSVVHLLPIAHQTDAVFGEQIRMVGYNLQPEAFAGDVLNLWLYWQPITRPTADYQVYIHVTPPGERETIVAQGDAPPTGNPYRPTSTWNQPGETMLAGYFQVPLPADVPRGDYAVSVGLYDRATGVRLFTQQGTDAVTIPLTVTD